jgi:uncharacterized protein
MYAKDELHIAANKGDAKIVKEILQTSPDVDARDSYGGTALHAAMFQDDIEIVRLLIEHGYDVNAVGPTNGYTPLHDAVWANNLAAVKLLVENGANLKTKGHDGLTPVEKAKKEGKEAIFSYFQSMMES